MLGFFFYLTLGLFLFICLLLILLVLIQKGRGGGLASAFGGGGGSSAFGSKTGDVLTWATSVIFGLFLLLAIAMNLLAKKYNKQEAPTINNRVTQKQPARQSPPPFTTSPATPTIPTIPTTLPATAPSK